MTKKTECYGKSPMESLLKETRKIYKAHKKALIDKGKKWKPDPNEKFYIVSNGMSICWYQWQGDDFDLRLRKIGNCFRTKREAQAALRRVKKALRGE